FGGEHSGHFYFRDFWRADSGMLAALHALAALAQTHEPLSEVLAPYSRHESSGEINSRVEDQQQVLDELARTFGDRDGVTLDHLDGLTVAHPDWWFNVRASNTEPLLRLNAEGKDRATMTQVRDVALAMIRRD
ncbi:MAG: phosphomannomutase/phosphoglucomutase, partial [Actinomycetota bacterium]|nr:phosphomannomutase/phosphoglucomutase [Actinomycetota bacterium]